MKKESNSPELVASLDQTAQATLPIGLFDSGVGGLTVMKEVMQILPNERLIYFGDTARLPYGDKSPDAIVRFALESAQFLMRQKIKLLIVSCHTVCSHAMDVLRRLLPIPIIGVQDPGVDDLVAATKSKRVAVLGTRATIASGVFQTLLQAKSIEVYSIACPLFVPLVEEGLQNHTAATLIAEHYLAPLKERELDAVLLACTHYPLLSAVIQDVLGPAVQLIEPARSTALAAFHLLRHQNLLSPETSIPDYHFYASDAPEKFRRLAQIFFPLSIEKVHLA